MTSQPTPPEARIAADANLVTLINVFTVEPSDQVWLPRVDGTG